MPVNRSVGVEKLFAACRRYFEKDRPTDLL